MRRRRAPAIAIVLAVATGWTLHTRESPEARQAAAASDPQGRVVGLACMAPVQIVWRDFRGATRDYGTIAPSAVVTQHSYVGHRWEVVDDEGATVARYVVEEDGEHVVACL